MESFPMRIVVPFKFHLLIDAHQLLFGLVTEEDSIPTPLGWLAAGSCVVHERPKINSKFCPIENFR